MSRTKWLRSKLKSLTPKKGFHKDVRTLGAALGSPIRKSAEKYVAKKKARSAMHEEALKIYEERVGIPYRPKYISPDKMKVYEEIIKELEEK